MPPVLAGVKAGSVQPVAARIEVRQLVKNYSRKTVLRRLDLCAASGEFVALMGPNGSGKTTLLRILATLTRPTHGRVCVAGFELPGGAGAVRQHLGFVSHQPLLYADLSAQENLRFFARLYAVSDPNRVEEVLEWVGLAGRRRELVRTFSRGMQQRLAIGRALLHQPQVLLFDEPHTGLDQEACDLLDALLRQVAQAGCTVILTSHDLARLEDLATRFDVLRDGAITASASRAELAGGNLLDFYRQALAGAA